MADLNFKICAFCSSHLYLCGYGKADGLYGCARVRQSSLRCGGALKVDVARYKQRVLQLAFTARRFRTH